MENLFNPQAEAIVISSVLRRGQFMQDHFALSAQHFEPGRHQIIWGGILQSMRQFGSRNLTPMTLGQTLASAQQLEAVGGLAYLNELLLSGFSNDSSNLTGTESRSSLAAIEILIELKQRRDLIYAAQCLLSGSGNLGASLQDSVGRFNQLYRDALGVSSSAVTTVNEALGTVIDRITENSERSHIQGLPTGLIDLDGMMRGLQPGRAYYVLGRPGSGKTVLANQIGVAIAQARGQVYYSSLEMTAEELVGRQLSAACSIPSNLIEASALGESYLSAIGQNVARVTSYGNRFTIDDANLGWAEMRGRIEFFKAQNPHLSCWIIDHLHLIRRDPRTDERHHLEFITADIKRTARELDIAIVCLAQMSRNSESRQNPRPLISDGRATGSIEQDADAVFGVFRPELSDPETEDRGVMEIIVLKHRNGSLGTVRVLFDGEFSRLRNLAVPSSNQFAPLNIAVPSPIPDDNDDYLMIDDADSDPSDDPAIRLADEAVGDFLMLD